jgi:heat shock protein HslJ
MTRHPLALAATAAVSAVLSAALAGCGDDSSSGGSSGGSGALGDLAGASFVSTQVTKGGDDYPLVRGTHISLQFFDSRLSAQAGCNILGGDASLRGDVIDVDGGLSMTEMGCDRGLMRQDDWLAGLLGASPVATLNDDRLTLTSGDTVVELLNEETANPDRPLTGTEWTLDSIGDSGSADGTVSSIPADVVSTLSIDDSGWVSVAPGCNTGGGQATVGDGVIDFGPIALTRMACDGAAMEVETAVMRVLDGTVDYRVDADTLTLTRGGATLTYRTR